MGRKKSFRKVKSESMKENSTRMTIAVATELQRLKMALLGMAPGLKTNVMEFVSVLLNLERN